MTTEYTPNDALRLLAVGIADDQACGHCDGTCGACQEDAAALLARVRARAIREARKAFYEKHPSPPMLGGNQEPGEGVGAKYAIDVAMDFLARFADEQESRTWTD